MFYRLDHEQECCSPETCCRTFFRSTCTAENTRLVFIITDTVKPSILNFITHLYFCICFCFSSGQGEASVTASAIFIFPQQRDPPSVKLTNHVVNSRGCCPLGGLEWDRSSQNTGRTMLRSRQLRNRRHTLFCIDPKRGPLSNQGQVTGGNSGYYCKNSL